ncbi:hypothetical protein QQ020_14830 [Fulvivirgaceae bacterium BMA12]|uniref:Group-specific protein n=1 Tax=Agaribacillus aureus TaxID=3051825 RepID=A0ABT8L6F9_9BACT|nr:hypothetical protein [Fulvivirgaceae bacterium BMA12]
MESKSLMIYEKISIKTLLLIKLLLLSVPLSLCAQGKSSWYIEFQDGFINDTVSLYWDDVLILDNEVLKSDSILGIAHCVVIIAPHINKKYFVSVSKLHRNSMPKLVTNNLKANRSKFTVEVNQQALSFFVSPKKGSFFGISKDNWDQDKIKYIQSKTIFEYD